MAKERHLPKSIKGETTQPQHSFRHQGRIPLEGRGSILLQRLRIDCVSRCTAKVRVPSSRHPVRVAQHQKIRNLHVELPLHQPTSFGEHLQQQLDGYENVGQHSPRQAPIFVRTRSSHLQINKVPHTRLHKVGDEVGPKLEMQTTARLTCPNATT